MKIKKIFIGLLIITSCTSVGCSNNISKEDKIIESIVIDGDTRITANANSNFNVTKILKTENLSGNKNGARIRKDGKLVEINYNSDYGDGEGTIYQSQFPKLYINSIDIGTITDKIENDRNIVQWEKKEITGQLLVEYMGDIENFKVLKDNKVYMLDNNYNFKEITAYKELLDKTNGDITRFEGSYDKNLDIYYLDNSSNKLGIVDTLNDKYYEINKKNLGNIENKRLDILTIEDDKIYVSLTDTSNETASTIGFIQNNKLTTFFDEESTIKVKVTGDVLYSNGNILFSGYVEDNYGIWNYNIESKKLEKQIELKYDYSYFKISKDKNFIVITNTNSNNSFNISLARIDSSLKISNIKELTNSILPEISEDNWLALQGWSSEDNKFYVEYVNSKKIDDGIKIDDIYYEVYEVK
ncbi:hypothetical protein H9660_04885 [Clostridium sp. Sa3CUN1]|uniref:Lipoprotein n=1 Tax=Clostridium gallinarum TaxID=2762246 RepID=A0ABR8Q223_9CLOT|nr:hypothetical protein [Clostridium gallinarum]MBD7914473.1 hypothetical protein [Clostridium gallinarum]